MATLLALRTGSGFEPAPVEMRQHGDFPKSIESVNNREITLVRTLTIRDLLFAHIGGQHR